MVHQAHLVLLELLERKVLLVQMVHQELLVQAV
jgi:hypothetical protein